MIADAHNDLLRELVYRREEPEPFGRHWLPSLRSGGVELQVCAINGISGSGDPLAYAWEQVDAFRRLADEQPDDVLVVERRGDLRPDDGDERIRLLLSMEGVEPLAVDIDQLDAFWAAGVRMFGPCWWGVNAFADGNGVEIPGAGLTERGRDLIARLAALGAGIDLAHASDRTFADVIEQEPDAAVFVSHSACRALHVTHRNVTDEQLTWLHERDGIVGILAIAPFIGTGRPAVSCVVDHIDHAMGAVGPGGVAIGADFMYQLLVSGAMRMPTAFDVGVSTIDEVPVRSLSGPDGFPALVSALRERGYDGEVLDGILRENLLRFLERIVPEQ
jgi:membrane dipeptidase